jgi:hypothetical protein
MKLLRYDSTDPGDFFDYALEAMRGNSESNAKSMRNGAAWKRKRQAARDGGATMTRSLPAWIEERNGERCLIPERAEAIRRIFQLAARGYGIVLTIKALISAGVPAFGLSGHWSQSYIALLLKDRRVLGEFQPRVLGGEPDGEVIMGYYPAVVTEEEWYAARAGSAQRTKHRGRQAEEHINVFAGLLKNALEGDSYISLAKVIGARRKRILKNVSGTEGRAKLRTFPFVPFEAVILGKLREIDPHSILNGDQGPDESLTLAGKLAGVQSELSEAVSFMNENGFSVAIGKRIADLESRSQDLTDRLAAARQKAAHPLSETWGEAKTLLDAIESADDSRDARLRLQTALRRIVESIQVLVVPRGKDRFAAVQIWFDGGRKHRDYLIFYQPPNGYSRKCPDGDWWVKSLAEALGDGEVGLDLRRRDHADKLRIVLESAPLDKPR